MFLISSHQHLKSCGFGFAQKIAVLQLLQPARAGFRNCMAGDQVPCNRARGYRCQTEPASGMRPASFGTAGSELQNCLHLLLCYAEFLNYFIDAHILQVLEDRRDRHPRSFEYPCAAALSRNALHSRALGPI